MNTAPKDRTPHIWDEKRDADYCSGCAKPFKKGERVINDCALTVHYTKECVDKYNADLNELGLL